MHLVIDAVCVIVLAILIDRYIGELPNRFHPLRWMGNLLYFIDRHVKNRKSFSATVIGFLSYLLVFFIFATIGLALTGGLRVLLTMHVSDTAGEVVWIVATAFVFKISFAVFSFRHHCIPICDDLDNGRTEDAASKVQMIVSRNTKGMDPEHIASSCCETVSENLVDSVYSPAFYFGLFGLPGAVMFRCANLMDAMFGYLNEKYARLGYFPAKFDDVLGFLTSRISPYFVSFAARLLHMDYKAAVPAAKSEHTKTPSPNSGWPMTAVAAALDISMEKKDVYVMGTGPMPSTDDVRRCLKLVEVASVIFICTLSLVSYVLFGIHVQLFFENLLLGVFI